MPQLKKNLKMLVYIVKKVIFYGRISNKCIEPEVNNQNYFIDLIIVTVGVIYILNIPANLIT